MKKEDIARVLLQILTKQRFKSQKTKEFLMEKGYITDKGNITASGKRFVWEHYK